MDNVKIGNLICRLRKENHMTQLQLAERMHISDKAVSKWERGNGCPDVSLLPELSRIFGVDLEKLLSGELNANDILGGNMKKMKFYICPDCGNVIIAMADTTISCCGKKLQAIQPKKAEGEEKLSVEVIENDYYISSEHEMVRDHYISFVALLTSDTMMLRKQYPEWGLQVRIPVFAHGRLLWYCSKHGLFYQEI
ncbi:MAG: helix-turn-helix domain-containing protein [Lachnospiraceae bacterium]|nr:helix-turn-helix domain-containing protein [Lachnospiraceae bacterium]MDY4070115.1 helix-turn-helix domain-containing protein [Lachnospiraceae bacterium]